MSVEWHSHFETKRVACSQARADGAVLHCGFPEGDGQVHGRIELKAHLSGISGSAHQHILALVGCRGKSVELQVHDAARY